MMYFLIIYPQNVLCIKRNVQKHVRSEWESRGQVKFRPGGDQNLTNL